MTSFEELDYRPSFPRDFRARIGIVGCGHIVRTAHLPAYAKHGCKIVGVYDLDPEATAGVCERFGVGQVFESLDALLAHSEIEIVDGATRPAVRPKLIREALAAGKHVLAQKPLAVDLRSARELVDDAERRGLRLAVNQNARWSPPWRIATLLIDQEAIGDVFAVTQLYDRDFRFVVDVPHSRWS